MGSWGGGLSCWLVGRQGTGVILRILGESRTEKHTGPFTLEQAAPGCRPSVLLASPA